MEGGRREVKEGKGREGGGREKEGRGNEAIKETEKSKSVRIGGRILSSNQESTTQRKCTRCRTEKRILEGETRMGARDGMAW